MAEACFTDSKIMSITGHKTDNEVRRYTKSANQKRLAQSVMDKAYKEKIDRKLSNLTMVRQFRNQTI